MAHRDSWLRTLATSLLAAAVLNLPGDGRRLQVVVADRGVHAAGPAGGTEPGRGSHSRSEARESHESPGAIRLVSPRGFLIAVRGGIGRLGGLTFILDTGSSRTAVDHTIARRLDLARVTDEVVAFGQRVPAHRVLLPSVQLGPLRATDLPAVATDLHKLAGALGLQPDAVIGLDVLLGTCFSVDYRRRTLTFGRTAGWDFSIALDSRSIHPVVTARIDGALYRLLVDTGSELIIIFDRARPANRNTTPEDEVRVDHMAGASILKRFTADSVRLADLELGRLRVFVSEGGEGLDHDGVFGPRWLPFARLQFDLERMVLSVKN